VVDVKAQTNLAPRKIVMTTAAIDAFRKTAADRREARGQAGEEA